MKLSDLEIGHCACIVDTSGEESLRQHLLEMGLVPGTRVQIVKIAPMGDPIEIRLRGYELSMRLDDASKIEVDNEVVIDECKHRNHGIHRNHGTHGKMGNYGHGKCKTDFTDKIDHPGVGEREKYPSVRRGRVLADGEQLSFALIGNQNCGKTTLFNALTGLNQHVGNFPGITVERKDGVIKGHPETLVTDLPGIYSLSPYSSEEIVTREFLLEHRPRGIINIIDATNIERNMYLTMQLIELNIPMVLALNMMDEVSKNGGTIKINELEAKLGIPVVPISAYKNEGIDELIGHALRVAKYRERPGRMDFCDADGDKVEAAIHRSIHAILHVIEDHAKNSKIPPRFAATKLVEGDNRILEKLHLDDNEKNIITHIIDQLEEESGMDRIAATADTRFKFIDRICESTVIHPAESAERKRSRRIDSIITGKYTAIPSFLGIMALMFYCTFSLIGPVLADWLNIFIEFISNYVDVILTDFGLNTVVHSLIIDGIFSGVGSVLSFLPIIVVLFFFLSIMEDSGYMARVAFIMDKPLRKIGLSGRSFVPMLIGFGCSVPAILATRTLSSERDRKMTILLTPFMSCSAKLPIYTLFTAAFFGKYAVLVIMILYVVGILAGILYAFLLRNSIFKGEPIPFVMELPNYRFPSPGGVLRLIWEKAKDFATKAFTIIFLASIVIWFLQTFDVRLNVVASSEDSILAVIGGFIAPIFAPLGFGDWKASTALITGFVAKESVVSTFTVLLGGDVNAISTMFTPFTAFVFLIFTLYYTPCVAAIAAVRSEFNSKKSAVIIAISQTGVAWILAFLVHTVGVLLGFA